MATRKRKRAAEPKATRGLDARRLASASPSAAVEELAAAVERDGGSVIGIFRDPLGGHWQLLAGLPIDVVEPTPYQRNLSEAHTARLADAIERIDRYLDPVIVVRAEEGKYWTPNGYHRLSAMRTLGARSIVVLAVPDAEVARRILLLNTEKSHNLRERALEVIRLAEALVTLDDRPEREFAIEFEEAPLLTLGVCYQQNGRFSGGVYHPVLKRCDKFLGSKLSNAIEVRRARGDRLLELNELVNEAVAGLKERGLVSPYLKAFVVARINPLRFAKLKRGAVADFDETIEKMVGSARRFDVAKIRVDQVARSGGGAPVEE